MSSDPVLAYQNESFLDSANTRDGSWIRPSAPSCPRTTGHGLPVGWCRCATPWARCKFSRGQRNQQGPEDEARGEVWSDTTASLRRTIGGAGQLQGVVRTMRAVAAAIIGQYEKSVLALGNYCRAVELSKK